MNTANLVIGWAVVIWMGLLTIRSAVVGEIMIPGLIGILFIVGIVRDQDLRSKVKAAERLERAEDEPSP